VRQTDDVFRDEPRLELVAADDTPSIRWESIEMTIHPALSIEVAADVHGAFWCKMV
jgi:hypothetical protein